jgi:hypothetical protein
MKKLLIAISFFSALMACTQAGEGSDTDKTKIPENTYDSTSKDTASYDRMPDKLPDSSKR